jgi:four helix bundle protein
MDDGGVRGQGVGGQRPGDGGREAKTMTVNNLTPALRSPAPLVKSFRDLRVWQRSLELVEEIYRVSAGFPQHEIYGLTNQLRRAAVSVPSNIAEGHTREHTKEYLHHVSMAQASLAEIETQLEIASRLKYLSPE